MFLRSAFLLCYNGINDPANGRFAEAQEDFYAKIIRS